MEKVKMFILPTCPYCIAARRWMDELLAGDPKYREVEIEVIDESAHPDIAGRHDYYYVPTFYVGNRKAHEGAASPKKIKRVFDAALR